MTGNERTEKTGSALAINAAYGGEDSGLASRGFAPSSTAERPRVYQATYDRTIGFGGITTANLCCRLLQDHADRLTVTRPTAKEPARLYAALSTGLLADAAHVLQALLSESHDIYGREIIASGIDGRELIAVAKHCRSLKEPRALASILQALGGVITDLDRRGALPPDLDVCNGTDIDANWRYMGAPNGVIDLATGLLLDRAEARHHRVSASVTDDYDPNARHTLVDLIMPPEPPSQEHAWLYRYRGWVFTHPVHRDLLAMGTPPNAGKTTVRNADVRSLGEYAITVGASAWVKSRGYSAGPASHNGQLTRMRTPARIAYSAELAPPLNTELLNELTGGDEGSWARDVREKAIELRRPPHLVFQFNIGPDQAPVLPIGGATSAEVALRDRALCLPMPAIPMARRDGRLLDIALTDKVFRQAWVARTVEQCVSVWNSSDNRPMPPDGCTTMKEELARQARAALPQWQTDLIPAVFSASNAGESPGVTIADSYTAYRKYLDWNESDGDGVPMPQGSFTTALKAHYGEPARRGKVTRAEDDARRSRYADAWIWPNLINDPTPLASSQIRTSGTASATFESISQLIEQESQSPCEKCEDFETRDPSRPEHVPPTFGLRGSGEMVPARLEPSGADPATVLDPPPEDPRLQPALPHFGFSLRGGERQKEESHDDASV